MANPKGMLPDEYMETSLIEVWPLKEGEDPDFEGRQFEEPLPWKEYRPDFYVLVVRRVDEVWHVEVMKAAPIDDGQIPGPVMERMWMMRKRIIHKQKSDKAKDAAAVRRAKAAEEKGAGNEDAGN